MQINPKNPLYILFGLQTNTIHTGMEHNKRVHASIQTFEYVWKRTRLKTEKCVLFFYAVRN